MGMCVWRDRTERCATGYLHKDTYLNASYACNTCSQPVARTTIISLIRMIREFKWSRRAETRAGETRAQREASRLRKDDRRTVQFAPNKALFAWVRERRNSWLLLFSGRLSTASVRLKLIRKRKKSLCSFVWLHGNYGWNLTDEKVTRRWKIGNIFSTISLWRRLRLEILFIRNCQLWTILLQFNQLRFKFNNWNLY